MYNIFNVQNTREVQLHTPPVWFNIKELLDTNLDRVTRYYRRSPMAVKSNHLLVRLLHSITIPKTQHTIRYYSNVSDIALKVAMSMGITSSIYKGRIFEGVFYGRGSQEIIIAHDTPFDYLDIENNWEDLEPIKVIRHPRSDLGFNIPDGKKTSEEDGPSVILINVVMLAMQYRAFRQQESKYKLFNNASERSIYQFIHMYPLTNMLKSQTDCALFNRFTRCLYDYPAGESVMKHSFSLMNVDDRLDNFNLELKEHLLKTRKDFFTILRSVKLLSCEDLAEFVELPNIPTTRQVTWALSYGLFPELVMLFRLNKETDSNLNTQEINRIVRRIKEYRNSNVARECLPTDLYIEFEQTNDELLELSNRRI